MSEIPPVLAASSPYRLVERIGAGAMGEVWRARDRTRDRDVVVKLMLGRMPAGFGDRLRLEAESLAKIRHENVVAIYDWGVSSEGRPYLVMEYLRGEPLDARVKRSGYLPVPEAVRLARQLIRALARVHDAGMAHRDVKPANMFVCDGGRLKLLDFGIIKLVERVTGVAPLQVPTKHGQALGTPRYMSPEQVRAQGVDGRSDLYSAGVVLYQLLSGRHPFEHCVKLDQLLMAHLAEAPKAPSEVAPQTIPERLDRLVVAALAKNPAQRPTAATWLRELDGAEAAAPASVEVPPAEEEDLAAGWRHASVRARFWLALVAAAVATAAAGHLLSR